MLKFVRIAGLHYDILLNQLEKNKTFCALSYTDKQKNLFNNAFVYSNSISRAMESIGYEAYEIVYDCKILQKTWAKEKGISFSSEKWQIEILLAQLKELRPDILYFQDIYSLPYEIKKNLKTLIPSLKLLIIFRGFPNSSPELLKELSLAEILLVGSPTMGKKCKEAGLTPYLFYHFFDETIVNKIHYSLPTHDFTFVGSSGFGFESNHYPRYLFLHNLMQKTPLQLWTYEKESFSSKVFIREQLISYLQKFSSPLLERISKIPLSKKWKRLLLEILERKNIAEKWNQTTVAFQPMKRLFPNRTNPSLFGLSMYQMLADSKITFNMHSNPAEGFVDNIRLFQATGAKTCLITDDGKNMSDLFEKDQEVITYTSFDECVEKVLFLLQNEKERKNIAYKGHQRTMQEHTPISRCRKIDELIQKNLLH